jgi:hypothetical protein
MCELLPTPQWFMNVGILIASPGSYLKQIHHMSVKSGILARWCPSSIFCFLIEIQSV